MNAQPDPRPPARVRDHMLLRRLHLTWKDCAIGAEFADQDCFWTRSLHHVHRHPRDDVQANLIMLCGDGTRGCHGKVEARDPETLRRLLWVINARRPEIVGYLAEKLGGREQAGEWLRRYVSAG